MCMFRCIYKLLLLRDKKDLELPQESDIYNIYDISMCTLLDLNYSILVEMLPPGQVKKLEMAVYIWRIIVLILVLIFRGYWYNFNQYVEHWFLTYISCEFPES